MKKIFTLFAGLLMAVSLFAADRRPVVKVNSSKNYKIVIDGRTYFGDDLTLSLDRGYGGRHSIKVFEMRRGYFGQREKLVASSSFQVDRKDVLINIDWFGNISIREKRNQGRYYDNDDRFPGNDRGPGHDRDQRDRDGRDRDGRY